MFKCIVTNLTLVWKSVQQMLYGKSPWPHLIKVMPAVGILGQLGWSPLPPPSPAHSEFQLRAFSTVTGPSSPSIACSLEVQRSSCSREPSAQSDQEPVDKCPYLVSLGWAILRGTLYSSQRPCKNQAFAAYSPLSVTFSPTALPSLPILFPQSLIASSWGYLPNKTPAPKSFSRLCFQEGSH